MGMSISRCDTTSRVKRALRARMAAVCSLMFAAAFGLSGSARASETFPAYIETIWKVSSLPVAGMGCKLCHANDDGGLGTVVQPFGKTMQAHGVVATDTSSLYNALVYVGQHSVVDPIVDSDGDGVPDYTEVAVDHTNPNDAHDFKAPPVEVTQNGGAGGDSGDGSVDDGGQASSEPVLPPVFAPPSAADLPPPFTHGCAMVPARSRNEAALTALFAMLVSIRIGGRRRTRAHHASAYSASNRTSSNRTANGGSLARLDTTSRKSAERAPGEAVSVRSPRCQSPVAGVR